MKRYSTKSKGRSWWAALVVREPLPLEPRIVQARANALEIKRREEYRETMEKRLAPARRQPSEQRP